MGIFEFLLADLILTFAGIIIFGLLVFCAETERMWTGLAAFVVSVIALDYLTEPSLWTWITSHPLHLPAYIVVYLGLGALYTAAWKWRLYCNENADPKELARYLANHQDQNDAENLFYKDRELFSLHPKNHYYRLTNWMLFWVFSLFWALLHDPITWLARTMYDLMGGIFLKIAVSASRR